MHWEQKSPYHIVSGAWTICKTYGRRDGVTGWLYTLIHGDRIVMHGTLIECKEKAHEAVNAS